MALPKLNSDESADLLSVNDYLAGENDGFAKHEYVAGQLFGMAGVTERHNRISLNVASLLDASLGGDCVTFSGDFKLRIDDAEDTRFYYPDVFVSCGANDDQSYFRKDAVLVVEVLSRTTERYDRFEKFHAYQRLPSLQENLLIAQEFPKVELFRRRSVWAREVFRPGDTVTLESINQTLSFEQIYRRVSFTAATGT
jgi:Uma2 family endonuclease